MVSEEFLGLYCLTRADAQTIVDVISDAFLQFQIPLAKLWPLHLYNQGWVGITCAGIPLYSSSFVYCVCLTYLSVES